MRRLLKGKAIGHVSAALGSPEKFKSAMGTPIRITRRNFLENTTSFAPPAAQGILGDVVLTNYYFDNGPGKSRYNVAHELGHVWDHNTGNQLSKGLMIVLGTWICDDQDNCRWFPFANQTDPNTLEVTMPEPPPGTDFDCWGADCDEWPYAATYGMGSQDNFFQKVFARYGWWPGWEDWAESFAAYVYPSYFPTIKGETSLFPNGERENYVKKAIRSIP